MSVVNAVGSPVEADPAARLTDDVAAAAERVGECLSGLRRVAVAFSGGVDSSVMTALAMRTLGADQVVAVLGVSPSLAESERVGAARTATALGVRLVEMATYELDDPRYVANAGNRCYFCKSELYTRAFLSVVAAEKVDALLNGDNADDVLRADRPGRRAALEQGVRSPLAEARIDKTTVRSLARAMAVPTWDKPAAPCLASRIPVRRAVTIEVLSAVERSEAELRALGLAEVRVRHHGALARIELTATGHATLTSSGDALAGRVRDAVRAAGFAEVEIDPVPLRRD